MRIQCPTCKTEYYIQAEKIPAKGATSKCKKCGNKIRILPPDAVAPLSSRSSQGGSVLIDDLDDLYEIVGQEINRGEERPGLMARATAEADGNTEKAKSLYIRYRVAELETNRQREAEQKAKAEIELFPEVLAKARKSIPAYDALSAEEKLKFPLLAKYLEVESPKILLQAGLHQHHTIGNIDAAVQRYKRVIKRFPNEQEARYAQKQLNRISAARKADPVQEKLAPIFTLLGFETSTEDPGKWIAKERTGSGVKPPESPLAESNASRPSAADLTRPIRSDPNPVSKQPAADSEIKPSKQPDFEQQWSDSSKQRFISTFTPQEAHPSSAGFKNPTPLGTWLRVLLMLGLFLTLVSTWSDCIQYELITNAKQGFLPSQATAEANDQRQMIIGVVQLVLFIPTGILFLMWIHRANSNARSLGAQGMRFTPGWAVGWYFIPVAHFWKPYQAMREIWKASMYSSGDWHLQPSGPLLKWWWAFWIVSNFFGNNAFKAMMKAEKLNQLTIASGLGIASDLLSIPLYITAILLVAKITEAQAQRHHKDEKAESRAHRKRNQIAIASVLFGIFVIVMAVILELTAQLPITEKASELIEYIGMKKPTTNPTLSKSNSTAIERACNSTVTVKTPFGHGSGFFVTSTGYIVTSRHVSDYAQALITDTEKQSQQILLSAELLLQQEAQLTKDINKDLYEIKGLKSSISSYYEYMVKSQQAIIRGSQVHISDDYVSSAQKSYADAKLEFDRYVSEYNAITNHYNICRGQ